MEDASIMPEMGTIEVRAFRVHITRKTNPSNDVKYRLHGGRVSERSKMAGWHHVRYPVFESIYPILIPCDIR